MSKAQKELKEMYRYILERDCWKDKSMVDYCMKECSQVVVLSNGEFTVLNKPAIDTKFCFGYGYYNNDYEEAAAMARHASTNESYFINENLKQITGHIEDLENYDIYFSNRYYNQPEGSPYVTIRKIKKYDDANTDNMRKATPEEIEILKQAYNEELEKFKKRLNIYLKRYGLSKVRTWTYNSWD